MELKKPVLAVFKKINFDKQINQIMVFRFSIKLHRLWQTKIRYGVLGLIFARHATRMGVATCWIGPGADHKSVVAKMGNRFDEARFFWTKKTGKPFRDGNLGVLFGEFLVDFLDRLEVAPLQESF